VVIALLGAGACRRADETRHAPPDASIPLSTPTPPRPDAPRPPPPDATNRLPEDPLKAKLATEQWDRHLEREDRERLQAFDRAHEREHEAVLAAIAKARKRYAAAKTKAAIRAAQAAFRASREGLEKSLRAIDPGGQSSELVPEYEEVLALLDAPYPNARVANVAGEPAAERALDAELDRRAKAAHEWLEGKEHEHDEHDAK